MTMINPHKNKTKIKDTPWYKFKESHMPMKQFNDLYEAAIYTNSCKKSYHSSLNKLEEMESYLFKSNLESSL